MLWQIYQYSGGIVKYISVGLHKSGFVFSGLKAMTLPMNGEREVKTNKSILWQIHLTQLLIIFHNRWEANYLMIKRVWEFNTSKPVNGEEVKYNYSFAFLIRTDTLFFQSTSFPGNLKNVLGAQRLFHFVGRGFLNTLTTAGSDWMRPMDWCCR